MRLIAVIDARLNGGDASIRVEKVYKSKCVIPDLNWLLLFQDTNYIEKWYGKKCLVR